MTDETLDEDIDHLDISDLRDEVRKLRAGIRAHRDSSGHSLCWRVPELWNLLPDRVEPSPNIPPWPEFMTQCAKYRASLDVIPSPSPQPPAEWLSMPEHRWFRKGYDYAQTQTHACGALSKVRPEELYYAVKAILRGAKRAKIKLPEDITD